MTFVKTALFHKAGEGSGGGGGGDQHNLGWYATESALTTAHATATAGDWAIVGATDTVWVWDTDNEEWVDSDQKGQVTSVNSQTGAVVLTAKDVEAVPQYTTMPVASASNLGDIVQFVGATGAYTNGYFYESSTTGTPSSATATQTVGTGLTNITVNLQTLESVLVNDYELSLADGTITIVCVDAEENYWDASIAIGEGSGSSGTDPSEFGVTYSGGSIAVGDTIVVTYTANSATNAWVRKDVQPAPEALPDQTGNAGKFLTTDGTDASWGALVAQTSDDSNRYVIMGQPSQYTGNLGAIRIGYKGTGGAGTLGQYSISIGDGAYSSSQAGISIGDHSEGGDFSIALGARALATGSNCAQINLSGLNKTNSDANTVKIANANGNFEIMSADGTIPTARLTKVNSTITLTAAGWSSNTQTVTVSGITATGVVLVSPDPTDQAAYTSAGILCTAQAADSLTFTCSTTPSADIDVNVVML